MALDYLKKSLSLTILSRLSIVASGLLVSILTARILGPSGRGEYFFAITLVNLVTQLSALGLPTSNTYFYATHPHLLPKLVANSVWVALLIGGFSAALIVGFGYGHSVGGFLWFVPILGPLYLFSLIGINLLAGMQKNKLFNLFQIFINLATVLAAVVGYFQKSLFLILLVTAILWLIVDLFLIHVLHRGKEYQFKFSWKTFNQGFFYAFKAYLVNMCIFLVLRLNVVLLQKMSVPAEIGYFSIAAQITDAIALLPMTIGILLFPDLLRLTDKKDSYTKAVAAMKMVLIILVPLVICAAVTAPFFIRIFYGNQFLPAIGVLNWMLPGSLLYGLVIIASQYLTAYGLPKLFVFTWIFSVLVDLVLSYLLIPVFAAQGAAMALSMTYFILFIFCAILIYFCKGKKLELQTIL